jgi:outer membrane protein insertion porin family
MLPARPPKNLNLLSAFIAGLIITGMSSCFPVVKNYQREKPFVFNTNINLIGNFTNDQKKELEARLHEQLDDSIRVKRLEKLAWYVIKKPPVYDSINADKSIIFMRALLKAQGYFSDSIYYTHSIEKKNRGNRRGDQYRTTVDFFVKPGKLVTLDTVNYNLGKYTELQKLADSSKGQAMVSKGSPFAKTPISAELDRLTDLYRNNGYMRFGRDELIGVWDTLDVSLLQPTLDPFEQLELLDRLKARRDSPTASLEIRLKNPDSARLVKYYVGNITIYPDVYPDYSTDTVGYAPTIRKMGHITVIQYYNMFKSKIFPAYIFLPYGSMYTQRRYLRTMNRLNSLGTWRPASIESIPRKNEDTVDFIIKLTPEKKYAFTTNFETSVNQSAFSGNLFGLGVNVGLQNRNFGRAANFYNLNLRGGIELGYLNKSAFVQSRQISLSYNISFPRLIPNFRFIPERWKDNLRTVFSFNAANTERHLLYNVTTLNSSWGYEYSRRNILRPGRSVLATVRLPNIEYSYLLQRDSLKQLIKDNPSLKNVFTDGFIASIIGNVIFTGGNGTTRSNVFRTNIEASGLLTGLIRTKFLDSSLYRFVKLDVEFARLVRYPKSSIAFRIFAGAGYEFNSTRDPDKKNNLPFFKQYFAGGPNSMRAWGLRRLGPGSVIKSFLGENSTPDRYGDIQIEANAEYRFPIGRPFGIKLNGALFTDIGNVWFMKKEAGLPEEVFKFSRLAKDLAIGAGAGLRIDFGFLVLRFDYSYKIKDPSPIPDNAALQNKWFGYKFFQGDQFQLGIGYPFIF